MAFEQKLGLLFACVSILYIMYVAPCVGQNAVLTEGKIVESKSVKKELKVKVPTNTDAPLQETHAMDGNESANAVLQNQEKPRNVDIKIVASPEPVRSKAAVAITAATPLVADQIQVEESSYKQKIYQNDDEIPDSIKASFYFFLCLSSMAAIFIAVKVYRLRLSRAERKYGVQGDRTTQELTPLPISIEDGNSDDEDQTLFEINRQQIRIL